MAHDPRLPQKQPNSGDIGDLDQAVVARRRADRSLSMSERLARVHALCKQMSAVQGAARHR